MLSWYASLAIFVDTSDFKHSNNQNAANTEKLKCRQTQIQIQIQIGIQTQIRKVPKLAYKSHNIKNLFRF